MYPNTLISTNPGTAVLKSPLTLTKKAEQPTSTNDISTDLKKIQDDSSALINALKELAAKFKSGDITISDLKEGIKLIFNDLQKVFADLKTLGDDGFAAIKALHEQVDKLGLPDNVTQALDNVFNTLEALQSKVDNPLDGIINNLKEDLEKINKIIDSATQGAEEVGNLLQKFDQALDQANKFLDQLNNALNTIITNLPDGEIKDVAQALEQGVEAVKDYVASAEKVIDQAKNWWQHFWS